MDEPVAWFCKLPDNKISIKIVGKPTEGNWEPLYTTPPKKEWVGLTDEEIFGMFGTYVGDPDYNHNKLLIDARRIEATLKEKNEHD